MTVMVTRSRRLHCLANISRNRHAQNNLGGMKSHHPQWGQAKSQQQFRVLSPAICTKKEIDWNMGNYEMVRFC